MTSLPQASKKKIVSTVVLTSFYMCTVDSLYRGITSWHNSCSAEGVETAQRIMGTRLSAIQDIYSKCCLGKTECIKKDFSQPAPTLFCFLPSGKQVRSISRCTSKYKDTLHPNPTLHAVTLDTYTMDPSHVHIAIGLNCCQSLYSFYLSLCRFILFLLLSLTILLQISLGRSL